MNLGLFLAIGESFKDFETKGQLKRLVNYNIKKYAQNFDKVYIFSYKNENVKLPKNCLLVPNKTFLHRYIYGPLIPLFHPKEIASCNVLRGLQITGGIPAILAKLIFGKPFVVNYGYHYAGVAKMEKKKLQQVLYPIIEEIVNFFADLILVTSPDLLRHLKFVLNQKISITPSAGIDLNLFKPEKQPPKKDNFEIVFVGRLESQKNLESLIKAVSMIKQTRVKLRFVGSGSLRRKLTVLSRQLDVDLQITPPIDYGKIPKILCRADIFVLPSLMEGNAKVITEAMACGIAVIGTKVAGISQLIKNGQTGLLCEPSPQSIKKAITKLFDYKLRQKLAKNARKFVEKEYNINKILDQEITLIKSVAK